jgi:hypothetical protein
VALSASALAGCTVRPGADDATSTVHDFYRAIADDDGDLACRLLAPHTREALESDTGEACAAAILDGDVGSDLADRSSGADDAKSTVAGREAQVVVPTDTVFLAVSDTAWVITAAGCEPRLGRPYDCALQGD